MKKVYLPVWILSLLFTACSRTPTTYEIRNNKALYINADDPLEEGTLYNLTVFCYIDGYIARQDNLAPVGPRGDLSERIEVPEAVERIRIAYTIVPKESDNFQKAEGFLRFVAESYYLDPHRNTVVEINDSTEVTGKLVDYYYSE